MNDPLKHRKVRLIKRSVSTKVVTVYVAPYVHGPNLTTTQLPTRVFRSITKRFEKN